MPIVALFIPIIAILAVTAIICLGLFLNYSKRKAMYAMYHQERMAAIDKGIAFPAISEAFLSERRAFSNRPKDHLFKGMLGIFVGIALVYALDSVKAQTEGNWSLFGLIPVGIGLAHLIYYVVVGRKEVEAQKNAAPPLSSQAPQPK